MTILKYLEGSDSVHRLWEGLCRSTVSDSVVFGGMCNFPHGVRYSLLSNHVILASLLYVYDYLYANIIYFHPTTLTKNIQYHWPGVGTNHVNVHIPSMRIPGTKLPESL